MNVVSDGPLRAAGLGWLLSNGEPAARVGARAQPAAEHVTRALSLDF